MRRKTLLTLLIFILAGCGAADKRPRKSRFGERPGKKSGLVITKEQAAERLHPPQREDDLLRVTELAVGSPEFHYTGKYCDRCHEQIPTAGGKNKYLKYDGDYNLLCKCHLKTPNSYIHPTDVVPSDKKKTKIPPGFPLEGGKLTCLTCHDIYRQCQKREVDRYSLRGMPYRKTTDFCFKCHDQSNYVMLNPHKQLDNKGNIIVDKCLYCHTEKPDVQQNRYDDPKLIGNLAPLCERCHIRMAMRGGSFNHLAKPSGEILAKMRRTEERFGAILPLDRGGRTTCATCHNPHDKGVIPVDKPAARGAGSPHRLRLPAPMCQWCHEMR
jgi:hypothetical protein